MWGRLGLTIKEGGNRSERWRLLLLLLPGDASASHPAPQPYLACAQVNSTGTKPTQHPVVHHPTRSSWKEPRAAPAGRAQRARAAASATL